MWEYCLKLLKLTPSSPRNKYKYCPECGRKRGEEMSKDIICDEISVKEGEYKPLNLTKSVLVFDDTLIKEGMAVKITKLPQNGSIRQNSIMESKVVNTLVQSVSPFEVYFILPSLKLLSVSIDEVLKGLVTLEIL